MTYTSITSSTQVSSLPDILNGVTTRTVLGQISTGPATSATFGVTCGLYAAEFGLNDNATLLFPIPLRVDNAVAPTLRLWTAPCASEASKEVEFTLASDQATASNSPVAGTGGDTWTTADLALSGTLGTIEQHDTTLGTAIWESATAGLIAAKLTRTAITDGTELTADCAVLAAALVYTIER